MLQSSNNALKHRDEKQCCEETTEVFEIQHNSPFFPLDICIAVN